VFVDPSDAERRVARLKDLTSGEQVEVPWDQLAERLA
jgi:histidyl-tRNA synthetase